MATFQQGSGARRYRALRDEEEHCTSTEAEEKLRAQIHDETRDGMMSIMNSMYKLQRWESKGSRNEGFKLAVMQVSAFRFRPPRFRPSRAEKCDESNDTAF